jgi:vitamin B12 transporter
MNTRLFPGLAGLTIALCTGPRLSVAAEVPAPEDNIIVTATRSAIPLQNAIVPVTVITRQDIEQSLASDLAELLRFEAGIDIGRNGGPGQTTSVFLRGTESNHTLVLIDGVRINPGTVGGAAVQYIAPETVERIEIVKGARSALFGTDAIGGVVNIITRRNERAAFQGSVGGGSFDTRSGFVTAGRSDEDSNVGFAVNWEDTEGYPPRVENEIDRGYENLTANLHAGKRLGSSYVTARHWQAEGSNGYLDFFLAPLDQDFRVASSALELRTDLSDDLESILVLSHINDELHQAQSDDFVESTRDALDWQLSLSRGNHEWIGGVYLFDENAQSLSFGTGFDEDTTVRAVFLENQWSSGRHRTFLAARLSDHESFGNNVTWNVEYAIDLNEEWSLTAGAGHAFRAPDATDRFGFGGNPDLDPEVAEELQAGVRFRPNGRHAFGLELYSNDIEDLIEFDLDIFQLRNIAEVEIRGAELDWEYRVDGFSLRAAFVRQSVDDAATGARLPRRAEESMTVNVSKDIGEHRLGLSVLASGDRADVGGLTLPGYVLANLTGRFALGERWRVHARVENVLDTEYQTAANYRMQARSYFLDLRFEW